MICRLKKKILLPRLGGQPQQGIDELSGQGGWPADVAEWWGATMDCLKRDARVSEKCLSLVQGIELIELLEEHINPTKDSVRPRFEFIGVSSCWLLAYFGMDDLN